MHKNPEASDQVVWHIASQIFHFLHTKFQPSKLQRYEFIVTFWTGQTCPPWGQKFLSLKATLSQTILACMYDNSTTKNVGRPLRSLENGVIYCKFPRKMAENQWEFTWSYGCPLKVTGFPGLTLHQPPTIKHHPNHHPLALGFRWAPRTRQTGTCGAANARHHLGIFGSNDWPTRTLKNPWKKKLYRRKMVVVKHKNCTLHEINLDTCVFSKKKYINKYILYRILLTPVPAFCVCQVLRFPAVWPYAPPAEFEKVEGNGTIHARRLTAIKLGVAGTDLGQKKSTPSWESQVISLHDLHWIPPTSVCPLVGS